MTRKFSGETTHNRYKWVELPLLMDSLIGAGSEELLESLLSSKAGREVKEYSTNTKHNKNKINGVILKLTLKCQENL